MNAIERQVVKAQRRLWLNRWLWQWGWCLFIASGIWLTAWLVDRLFLPGRVPKGWTALAAFGLSLVASAVWLWRTRERPLAAATVLDEAAGLRERVSSGLCVQSQTADPFARVLAALEVLSRVSHSSRWLSLWPTAPWASRRRYGRALKRNRGLLLSPLWNEDIAVLLWSSSLSVLVLGSSREERTRGHHDHHPLRHGHLCCFSPVFLASETLRGLVQTHRISRGTPQRQAEAGGTAELVKRIVLSRKAHPCLDRRPMSLSSSFCSLSGLHPPPSARKLPPFSSLAPSLRTESAKR